MFGWFGEVFFGGGRGKVIRIDVCGVFIIWPREKSGKPQNKIMFLVFNTCKSSPILLFCPRNPKPDFSLEIQKDARRKMNEICLSKS